jgi:hypothetical protein
MNTRQVLRLLAVASLLSPGIRLLAVDAGADPFGTRNFSLNLLEKDIRDTNEREETRQARKEAAKTSPLSAANFDLNKDGKLDDTEFAAWSAAVRKAAAKSPEALKRFDKNKDGKLDDAEWTAASVELFGKR